MQIQGVSKLKYFVIKRNYLLTLRLILLKGVYLNRQRLQLEEKRNHLVERPTVLVLGAGGGADVLRALVNEARAVDAVDLNRQMIELVRRDFADFAGGIYGGECRQTSRWATGSHANKCPDTSSRLKSVMKLAATPVLNSPGR